MHTVKSVDVLTSNPGAAGVRRGDWVATLDDGRQFVFWDSVSHSATIEEQEAILKEKAQTLLEKGNVVFTRISRLMDFVKKLRTKRCCDYTIATELMNEEIKAPSWLALSKDADGKVFVWDCESPQGAAVKVTFTNTERCDMCLIE